MGDAHKSRHMVDAGMGSVSAVIATLPVAYTLGESRTVAGVDYVLCYNAGTTAITPGMFATNSGGGYSVTVSTAANLMQEIGAVVNNNAASVPTANYFWGAKRGVIASGLIASAACVPTASAFYIGANGNVIVMPASVVTGLMPAGVALTTILSTTSGGGRNGSAYLSLF